MLPENSFVERLEMRCFRNHFSSVFETGGREYIQLIGPNGAGKTSVLEALYLLSVGRGIYTRKDSELAQAGQQGYFVEITWNGMNRLGLKFEKKSGRTVFENEKIFKQWSEVLGRFRVVLFRPEDIELVVGGPRFRRQMLDILLSQKKRKYFESLKRYRRAYRQHLGSFSFQNGKVQTAFEKLMAEEMPILFEERKKAIRALDKLCSLLMERCGFPGRMSLSYRPAIPKFVKEEETSQWTAAALEENRRLERGGTQPIFGPQRDDIEISWNDKPLREFGSRGQKRLASLFIRLATAVIHYESGVLPVLLLDDVLGELDGERLEGFLMLLKGWKWQIWVAGTDRQNLPTDWRPRRIFDIKRGTISGVTEF
ncbi:MAG: DNA replication and repair protein RecF [Candidatus Hydrogenedentota bacterium]|nr:MAG: DNA replication and repair protein RecF [Candidatus Hydrogenedentota bacterium]